MNKKYIRKAEHSKKYLFTEKGLEAIDRLLSEGNSYRKLSKVFEINPDTLAKMCKEYGISRDNRRKYSINDNYFENINSPEQAYWLGFLDADGYVYRNKIMLVLQRQDEDTIQKFLSSIQSDKEVLRKEIQVNGKKYSQSYVSIDSIQMVKDLKKYGCVRKKSLILLPPKDLQSSLVPYWILGYMDGDGCVSVFMDRKNELKRLKVSFTGTYEVLSFIKQYFNNNSTIRKEHRCKNNTYNFSVTESKAIEFLNYVYSNEDIYQISLTRKRKRFFNYLEYRKERYASKSSRTATK